MIEIAGQNRENRTGEIDDAIKFKHFTKWTRNIKHKAKKFRKHDVG